ncbi:nitroreductase family protein [Novipirellula artificiosorum]|uniref:NADH dehydrogenase n=1 Tax=Novipirellula artificiosorum TaxID=2528016 RepID=A0A5C6DN82_9BACT|nr:nitroreductase family protein [Novipirellula artificiosorum]TWU38300.1 NADH dehydrogenase [Novipirellula artificiosorum]
MEAIQALMTRRSIRSWKNEPVTEQQRKTIMEAAMNAPSAADARPWHFVTIDKPEVTKQFTQMGGTEMLEESTFMVMVCGDESKEIYPGFWPQDCSCAAQNMQLAAHAIGIGCVWIAIYPLDDRVETCRKVLGIPQSITPFALLAMGVPNEVLTPEYRYDEERLHQNKW